MWMGGEGKQGAVKLGLDKVKRVTTFKYLGSNVMDDGGMDSEINHWICHWRVGARVKGRFYKSVVKPAMVYGQ